MPDPLSMVSASYLDFTTKYDDFRRFLSRNLVPWPRRAKLVSLAQLFDVFTTFFDVFYDVFTFLCQGNRFFGQGEPKLESQFRIYGTWLRPDQGVKSLRLRPEVLSSKVAYERCGER